MIYYHVSFVVLILTSRSEQISFKGECFGTGQYILFIDDEKFPIVNNFNAASQLCTIFDTSATLARISSREGFLNARSLIEASETLSFLQTNDDVVIGVFDKGEILDVVERFEYSDGFPNQSYIHSGVGVEPWREGQPNNSGGAGIIQNCGG